MAIAEELKLRGLTGNGNSGEAQEPTHKPLETEKKPKNTKLKVERYETEFDFNEDYFGKETTIAIPNDKITNVDITDKQELNEKVKSMMKLSENTVPDGPGRSSRAYVCTVCGKQGKRGHIKDHIEVHHIEGVSIPCNYCEKIFRTRDALRHHNSRLHK